MAGNIPSAKFVMVYKTEKSLYFITLSSWKKPYYFLGLTLCQGPKGRGPLCSHDQPGHFCETPMMGLLTSRADTCRPPSECEFPFLRIK